MSEIVIPAFGYKNHIGIDRTHGFVRRFTVTHAAAPDGRVSPSPSRPVAPSGLA